MSADKAQLRAAAIAARLALPEDQRRTASATIVQQIYALVDQQCGVEALLAYRALTGEVDLDALFASPPCSIYAPVTERHDSMKFLVAKGDTVWKRGSFGILEPDSGSEWCGGMKTVLLMPLTAFDRSGNRLGMGKGCFDFWLAGQRQQIDLVIGVAFACQEVAQLPAEGHDVPMDMVITEQEVIACRSS